MYNKTDIDSTFNNYYNQTTINSLLPQKQPLLTSSTNLTCKHLDIGSTTGNLNLYYGNTITENASEVSNPLTFNCKGAFNFKVNGTSRLSYDSLGMVVNYFCQMKALSVLNSLNCYCNCSAPNIYIYIYM